MLSTLTGHGSAQSFAFHTLQDDKTEEEKNLSDQVSTYWGNFVRSRDGNPNNAVSRIL